MKMNHQKSFALFVVANTELANPAYQKKHGIKTKKLLIPLDLYKLRSDAYHQSRRAAPIVSKCDFSDPAEYQTLEFIYECFSYDAQELMKIYEVFFWFNTLYNAKVAREWMLKSSKSAAEQYAEQQTADQYDPAPGGGCGHRVHLTPPAPWAFPFV